VPIQAACPEGVAACNDSTSISGLVPLFPVAVLLAFVLAWPVSIFLPRRPLVGWLLAAIGAAGYIVFAAGPVLTVAIAFAVGVIGIALALGRRASAAVPGTPPSRT